VGRRKQKQDKYGKGGLEEEIIETKTVRKGIKKELEENKQKR
jgi:hypothetical protein